MIYADYTWDLFKDLIILDEDLDIDQLGWKTGDHFRVENRNGRVMLVKVNAPFNHKLSTELDVSTIVDIDEKNDARGD